MPPKQQLKSAGAQTEIMQCEECEFPADCIIELVDHMHEFHPLENKRPDIECNYCGLAFQTKSSLMIHRKEGHTEKVSSCVNFKEGKCDYGELCWFSHDQNAETQLNEYACNLCEKKFKIKSKVMKHRKECHENRVPICRNGNNCQYGSDRCWFNHHEKEEHYDENNDAIENSEVIEKLFNMMEKLT